MAVLGLMCLINFVIGNINMRRGAAGVANAGCRLRFGAALTTWREPRWAMTISGRPRIASKTIMPAELWIKHQRELNTFEGLAQVRARLVLRSVRCAAK
jgi:hypothetical protein